jgi:hypothetical protein
MDTRIVEVYCLCEDMSKAFHHKQDLQCQMTDQDELRVHRHNEQSLVNRKQPHPPDGYYV